MTTIAYKDGIIAGDGRVTADGHITCENLVKIVATKSHLAGVCGAADYAKRFLEWVKGGCNEKAIPKTANNTTGDIEGMVIDSNGNVTFYGRDMLPLNIGKVQFHAIGSGSAYALGAMAAGADAVEAIRIAIKYDAYSGGRVARRGFNNGK